MRGEPPCSARGHAAGHVRGRRLPGFAHSNRSCRTAQHSRGRCGDSLRALGRRPGASERAPLRACRLSMGSPRRRTSGMHSAAAPRSAAMRRLSSAARSLALASASAATDRNAPCDLNEISTLLFATARPGEAARAPDHPALVAASRGALSRALHSLSTSSTMTPGSPVGPGVPGVAPPSAGARCTRPCTHLNTNVTGAWG